MGKIKKFSVYAALLIPIGATPAEEPAGTLKDGLWSIHTQFVEHPSEKKNDTDTFYCRSRVHDDHEKAATKPGANCKTISDTTSGVKRTKETECKAADSVVKTKFTLTVTSDASTHTETVTSFDPPSAGRTGNTILTDQKYVGACPAGVVPGDLLDASGKVFHHGKP